MTPAVAAIKVALTKARAAKATWDKKAAELRAIWAAATLDLARQLWAERKKHSSDQAFGRWLETNKIDLDKSDRAALISLGQHEQVTARVLKDPAVTTMSWQLLWNVNVRMKIPTRLQDPPRSLSAKKPSLKTEAPQTDAPVSRGYDVAVMHNTGPISGAHEVGRIIEFEDPVSPTKSLVQGWDLFLASTCEIR
jgi:hypothetical protein